MTKETRVGYATVDLLYELTKEAIQSFTDENGKYSGPLLWLSKAKELGEYINRKPSLETTTEKSSNETPKTEKILVADDEPGILDLLTIILQRNGYKVVSAKSGTEAWKEYNNGHKFAAVVTGFNMPGMDGGSLAKRIYEKDVADGRSPTPVVFVTASAGNHLDNLPEGLSYKVLRKPFKNKSLTGVIREVIQKSKTI